MELVKIFFLLCTLVLVAAAPWEPVPRNDPNWLARHESFVQNTALNGNRISAIFIGASITDWFPDDLFNENYGVHGAVNYGIAGDGVEHAMWRILNGEVSGLANNLKLLVFADCGSNNVGGGWNANDISRGYQETIRRIQELLPNTKILVMGLMPRDNGNIDRWTRLVDVNIRNSKYDDLTPNSRIKYLDVWTQFSKVWGEVEPALFLDDQLHLTRQGYEMWVKIINPIFEKMIS